MTVRLRYRVGDENDPDDPWGRTELLIDADGSVRLEHSFPHDRGAIVRTGQLGVGALDVLWSGLDRAGFPTARIATPAVGAKLRRLAIEENDGSEEVLVGWEQAASLPGYAEAFEVLDGVVRELGGDAVQYPTEQHEVVAVSGSVPRRPPGRRGVRSARWAGRARVLLAVAVLVTGVLLVYQPFRRAHELDRYGDQLRRTGERVQAVVVARVEQDGHKRKLVCHLGYDFHSVSYQDAVDCENADPGSRAVLIWVNPNDPHDYVTQDGVLSGTRNTVAFLLGVLGAALILTSPAIFVGRPGPPEPEPESETVPAPQRRPMRPIRRKRSRQW
jgi:hypothetical protein